MVKSNDVDKGWLHWSQEFNLPKDVDEVELRYMEATLMTMMHLHLNLHLDLKAIRKMVDYKLDEINHIFPQMMKQFPAWDKDGTKPKFS